MTDHAESEELPTASSATTKVDPPSARRDPGTNRDQYLAWYRRMVLIRQFEEAAAEMYTGAKIGGYLHLNVGEEATVVGAIGALEAEDYVFSNYREHGHAIARGVEPGRIMAELFGKVTGVSHGRGGSMHLFDRNRHFMGGYGIVGGSLPIAVGAALALQYQRSDAIVLAIFGEGASNIGAFHESLNLARLWSLPIVFLCVNNQYAMGKSVSEDSAVAEIWRKAAAYNMPAQRVDGMDLLAVSQATQAAVEQARHQHQPSLLEAVTYRFRGHSMADAGRYRDAEELDAWRQRDPIAAFGERLVANGVLNLATIQEIQAEVQREIEAAVSFAEASPFPAPSTLYDDLDCSAAPTEEGAIG